jgi:hypothetical protein
VHEKPGHEKPQYKAISNLAYTGCRQLAGYFRRNRKWSKTLEAQLQKSVLKTSTDIDF